MKLPRNLSGEELAQLLSRYGYRIVRQTGSHMRLSSSIKGTAHRITIPKHEPLRGYPHREDPGLRRVVAKSVENSLPVTRVLHERYFQIMKKGK